MARQVIEIETECHEDYDPPSKALIETTLQQSIISKKCWEKFKGSLNRPTTLLQSPLSIMADSVSYTVREKILLVAYKPGSRRSEEGWFLIPEDESPRSTGRYDFILGSDWKRKLMPLEEPENTIYAAPTEIRALSREVEKKRDAMDQAAHLEKLEQAKENTAAIWRIREAQRQNPQGSPATRP